MKKIITEDYIMTIKDDDTTAVVILTNYDVAIGAIIPECEDILTFEIIMSTTNLPDFNRSNMMYLNLEGLDIHRVEIQVDRHTKAVISCIDVQATSFTVSCERTTKNKESAIEFKRCRIDEISAHSIHKLKLVNSVIDYVIANTIKTIDLIVLTAKNVCLTNGDIKLLWIDRSNIDALIFDLGSVDSYNQTNTVIGEINGDVKIRKVGSPLSADTEVYKRLNIPDRFARLGLFRDEYGYIVYKKFALYNDPPDYWDISENSIIEELGNTDDLNECGVGINVANARWLTHHISNKTPVWKCRIRFEWLAGITIPIKGTGKIRTQKLELLHKISDEELKAVADTERLDGKKDCDELTK